jgi:acyl-CoA synthetase (NDP forming)
MSCVVEAKKMVEKALASGAAALLEDDAKTILSLFGIPVVKEQRVGNSDEAVDAAVGMGFPVVLKAMGGSLTHKTELGLVRVGLASETEVREAADALTALAGDQLEALLVQPMVKGKRELVAGMFRDPQFGPVIMFGLGGVFTEALDDVVFRIAPLGDYDMDQMMAELSSKKLLGSFRGEDAADVSLIKAVLKGLSDIAEALPMVREIDINPLIITPTGDITAVDALMVVGKEPTPAYARPRVDPKALGELFYPDSVAFVGASATLGKWGHMLLTNTLSGDYQGEVYLVNPRGGTITGRKVYRSVSEIEGRVDLAVVTIPARMVPDLIPEFKAKGIKGMLLITSGFGETGPEGVEIEKQVVKEASKAGIIILGPNTMGICNPHKGFFCSGAHVHPMPGSTALVCQSGNMGTQLLAFASQQNIGIRAFSGSGNEAMVTIEDYMEAFEVDELTRTVVLYLESVKEGRRFFESAARVSTKKPVVILSGGRTEAGGKAAASHTGALASDAKVLSAACKQAGVIQVDQPMELLDLSAVFSSLPLPKGNRVAIMTLGGGWGVVTADLCMDNGLTVPTLSTDITERLDTMLPSYWSRANPLDIVGENDPNIPRVTVEELLKWDGCDAVIHLGIHGRRVFVDQMVNSIDAVDPGYSREQLDGIRDALFRAEDDYVDHVVRLTEQYEKPVLGVSLLTDHKSRTLYRVDGCKYKGVFFPSPERAVKALSGMVQYAEWLGAH